VIGVELLSRRQPQDPWRLVADRQFYRVNTADAELRNLPVDVATNSDRYWLARAVGPSGLPTGAAASPAGRLDTERHRVPRPRFRPVHADVRQRIGAGGGDRSQRAADGRHGNARDARRAPATGRQARLAKPAEFPWKQALLWAVLGLSVCLLAWMAYRVSREMGEIAPP